jgi:hypothetical protein
VPYPTVPSCERETLDRGAGFEQPLEIERGKSGATHEMRLARIDLHRSAIARCGFLCRPIGVIKKVLHDVSRIAPSIASALRWILEITMISATLRMCDTVQIIICLAAIIKWAAVLPEESDDYGDRRLVNGGACSPVVRVEERSLGLRDRLALCYTSI